MHQCVRCKHEYMDMDPKVLSGCSCGSKLFFFIRNRRDIQTVDEIITRLAPGEIDDFQDSIDRMNLERKERVDAIIKKSSGTKKERKEQKPLEKTRITRKLKKSKQSFGIETVKSLKSGVYEINISGLLEGQPVIVLSKGGSYIIHLPSAFEATKKQ